MKTIKATTTRGRQLLSTYVRYDGFRLEDVYDNFSCEKARAWDWCYELYAKDCGVFGFENVTNFHICTHNTYQFTVAWKRPDGVRIETANNSYLILV